MKLLIVSVHGAYDVYVADGASLARWSNAGTIELARGGVLLGARY